jgi:hypothetical protein
MNSTLDRMPVLVLEPHSRCNRRRFQLLHLENRAPVLVDADVDGLRRAAAKHLGDDLRLAGKRILA